MHAFPYYRNNFTSSEYLVVEAYSSRTQLVTLAGWYHFFLAANPVLFVLPALLTWLLIAGCWESEPWSQSKTICNVGFCYRTGKKIPLPRQVADKEYEVGNNFELDNNCSFLSSSNKCAKRIRMPSDTFRRLARFLLQHAAISRAVFTTESRVWTIGMSKTDFSKIEIFWFVDLYSKLSLNEAFAWSRRWARDMDVWVVVVPLSTLSKCFAFVSWFWGEASSGRSGTQWLVKICLSMYLLTPT